MKICKKIKLIVKESDAQEIWEVSKILNNLYNSGLRNRITRYQKNRPTSLYEQKRLIPKLKKLFAKYRLPFGRLLHETLIQLDRSYTGFFARCKKGDSAAKGFPRFRSSSKFFTHYIEKQHVTVVDGYFLYKFGKKTGKPPLKLKLTEDLPEDYGMVMLSHNSDGFYLSVTYCKTQQEFEDDGSVVAIDLGIKRLSTSFSTTGKVYFSRSVNKTMRYFNKIQDKLRSKRSKCKKHSRRYKYWSKKIQHVGTLRTNKVRDFLHKESSKFCKQFVEKTIVIGQLSIPQMSKKKDNKPNLRFLNRSLYEWNLSQFKYMLKYKSELYGKRLVEISEAYTSKTCCNCGNKQDMPLHKRVYNCLNCGFKDDRDLNSAVNILNRFLAQIGLSEKSGNLMLKLRRELTVS